MSDDPHDDPVDDSDILKEAFEGPMNVKNGGPWAGIVVGLTVSLGGVWFGHWMDGSKDKETLLSNTATSVAKLQTSVDDLSEQVKRLMEQPYVRREEFESRVTGLTIRVDNIERTEQSRRRQ